MKRIPENSIVRLIDLPPGIGGAVMEDENGFVSIYVNARHGHYAQLDDLEHEIAHIENDDLHSEESIGTIEARADGLSLAEKNLPKLIKASDLIPPPPPEQQFKPSPQQLAVLRKCISEIDSFLFSDKHDYLEE